MLPALSNSNSTKTNSSSSPCGSPQSTKQLIWGTRSLNTPSLLLLFRFCFPSANACPDTWRKHKKENSINKNHLLRHPSIVLDLGDLQVAVNDGWLVLYWVTPTIKLGTCIIYLRCFIWQRVNALPLKSSERRIAYEGSKRVPIVVCGCRYSFTQIDRMHQIIPLGKPAQESPKWLLLLSIIFTGQVSYSSYYVQ